MSQPITANIPHSLGKDEAHRRLAEGFASIERQMASGLLGVVSFNDRWEGDRLHFEGGVLGQRINGRLDVFAESVQIQVDLPEILAALADRFNLLLKKETQLLLEKK
jgi:hypothetical protein